MNEELTNEVLEAIKRCSETSCSECLAVDVCCSKDDITIGERLATALIEERAKPKAWDGAPETASTAYVFWSDEDDFTIGHKCFTRELPKTRARQIAEKISAALSSQDRYKPEVKIIESALNKYAEELKEASHDK